MNDRELLEAAAKAVGLVLMYEGSQTTEPLFWREGSAEFPAPWNPLDDDGDALRLAVKLDMQISLMACAIDGPYTAVYCSNGDGQHVSDTVEEHDGDPYAATRRAIVKAAAAMTAGKPELQATKTSAP